MSSGPISHHHDSQIYLILQFISRTARVLAHMVEQGADVQRHPDCSFDPSVLYLGGLRYAIWKIIGVNEAGQFPVPEWARMRKLIGSYPHARHEDNRTAVPVIKSEIVREYRLLYSDSEQKFMCGFCCAEMNSDFYSCSICWGLSCAGCQLAFSVLSLRERLEEYGQLRRLETEVGAVLQATRLISHQGTGTMLSVLSQGALLQQWVFQKDLAYQNWRSSRSVYGHFQREDWFGWKAIHTLSSILSLSARSRKKAVNPNGADVKQDEDVEVGWSELSEQWRDMFAFDRLEEDTRTICVHHCWQFVKIPRNNRNTALDPSGGLSAEFFEYLANKYEAALKIGTSIIDFLDSKSFPSNSYKGLDAEKQSSVRSPPGLADLTPRGESSKSGPQFHVDATRRKENKIDHPKDLSPLLTESVFAKTGLEDDGGTEHDLDDFLESLLAKRSCLVKEGRFTNEDDLVFNTAWNMAQAIVDQDTPRPSLSEIADKGEGYYTAPSTPVPFDTAGHSGTSPSSYGTPRSMSPVSWILDLDDRSRSVSPISCIPDLDEQPAALDMEIPVFSTS